MTVDMLRGLLGWCSLINIGVLLWWFLWLLFAHDFIYRIHSKWFKIPVETFDAIHYMGIVLLEIAILLFNLAPYFALLIVA